MQLTQARDLREQRAKLVQQARDAYDSKTGTPEERSARFDSIMADADRLKPEIDRAERLEAAETETRSSGAPPQAGLPSAGNDPDEETRKRYDRAFTNYLRYGFDPKPQFSIMGITPEERAILTPKRQSVQVEARDLGPQYRDMGSGGQGAYPGATTGFFVPVGFTDKITEALKYYGNMLAEAEVFDTSTGQPLPFPTDNDTSIIGELVGENQQVNAQDVSIGQIMFGAYKFSSRLVKVSIELLQDSAFDFDAFLTRKFAIRLGRILNNKFTVGTGTNQPTGIITAATAGPTAVGSFANDGVGGANTIGSDDLIELEHSVDPLYRPGAKYMMNDLTLKVLKKLKDKFGRPLWLPGLAVKEPDTINSYPFSINNDMATLPSTVASPPVPYISVAFGQLKLYGIRRVKDMSVLRLEERFADFGQVAFLAFYRADGNLLDAGTHPVKYLTNQC
jgi:HK97 family phage major capsid protein